MTRSARAARALAVSAVTPIVKWAGGKTRMLPELLARMPATYGRYFEPFAGGLALFFAAAPGRAVLNDLNLGLVEAYRAVANDVGPVVDAVAWHRERHGEAHYYAQRELWNAPDVATLRPADRAALFVYLNRTCFNGLWRVNRAGEFNVPMGRYADPLAGVDDKLRAAAPVLARATLGCADYRIAVDTARSGDFIYLDPPYDGTFTAYTDDGFGERQQRQLADTVRWLVLRGVRVMLSNSDTPLVRSLYEGFRVDAVSCVRAINSNTAGRGAVGEVIVTAGYAPARPAHPGATP